MPNKIIQEIQNQLTQLVTTLPELGADGPVAAVLEKLNHLAESMEHQERLLETIAALSEAVGSILDVDELLRISSNLIKDHFGFDYVGVFLIDETEEWAELVAQTSQETKLAKLHRLKIQDASRIAWVIQHQQVYHSPAAGLGEIGPGTLPEIIIPLISRDHVIGALVIQSEKLDTFSEYTLHSLRLLGQQLVSAIQSAVIFISADQQLEQLVTLHEVNLQIGSHLNLNTLLQDVTRLSTKLVNANSSIVRLIDEQQKWLNVEAACNPPDSLERVEPFGSGLSSVVIQNQQALLINHWPDHPLAADHYTGISQSTPILAVLNVPLALQHKMIGTIEVLSFTNLNAFNDNDLYTLSLLASQAATAIENTRLFSQLESNQGLLKTVIEHIPDPIFLKDKNHTWIEMNQANAAVLGRPEQELIDKTDKDYFSLELAEEFYRRDDEVLRTNQIFQHEDTTIWGDGQTHTAYTRLIPISGASGQPEYILGITHDITERKAYEAERKRAEEDLRASEARYRQLVQSANSIIFRMDPQGYITFFNNFAQDFFGYTEAEILGKNVVGTIVPAVDTAGHDLAMMIRDILVYPEEYSSNDNENIRHNGERVWVSWANKAILDDQGNIVEILCVGNDVTARKQAEAEILRQNEELAILNHISSSITSTFDLASILQTVVQEMVQLFKVRHCGIALFNSEKTTLTVIADYSSSEEDPKSVGVVIPVTNNPSTRHVINTGQSIVVPQAQTSSLTVPVHELMRRHNTQSLMIVPLRARGEIIGTLGLDTADPHREFTPAEIRLAETIAAQVAGAIANAHLFEQTQAALIEREAAEQALAKRERYLATQLEIQNLLLASTGHELPYTQILKLLGEVSQVSRVYLFENDQMADRRVLARQKEEWCAPGIQPTIDQPQFQEFSYKLLPRWADELARGNIISGPVTHFPETEQKFLESRHVLTILVLPLTLRGEFFGFIGFDNCVEIHPWGMVEIDLLRAATAAISLWYERRRAEEGLIAALQRTESLYRIGDAMATSTDPYSTFETILGEYLRLLKLKWGALVLLLSERSSANRVCAMYVDGQPVQIDIALPATSPMFQHLLKNPKPLVIGDVYTHPLTKDNQRMRQKLQARSMLFVPVVLRGKITGIISAGSTQKDYVFGQSDIETGQAVADQLAIWLDNRQLLTEAQHRSERLQTAAEISRAASSILDVDTLINTSVNLIRDQFNLYYVGLFLVDEAREWAVLRAGTGEAGRIQLEMKHRLKIGGESMIGWSIQNCKARIALDVGQEGVRFQNPILPETHSEMALPLISREEVIGALTVQSSERGVFSNEDVTLLQTMADQIANAIVNARLFETVAQAQREAENRLRETQALQRLSQELAGTLEIGEILDIFFRACTEEIGLEYVMVTLVDKAQHRVKAIAGFGVTESNIKRANRSLDSEDIMADIIRTGKTEIITGWDDRFDRETFEAEGHEDWVRIFTPITLRQENIGLVEAGFNRKIRATIQNILLSIQPTIQEYQIRLLHAFINQVALALDNAHRYQASQRIARREALIKEITTKVRASTNLEDILQTAIKEIGQVISNKRTYIHLVPPAETQDHIEANGKVERRVK